MNYLGHLYLSGNDPALMQANLFGDFVKGSHLEHFPAIVQEGVRLHRSIDHFIDHHPVVRELLVVLRSELPKVAGIAVDIYFDHLLAKNWKHFHPQDLDSYLAAVYKGFDLHSTVYPDNFLFFLKNVFERNWISSYHTLEAVDRMSHNISRQLSFPNTLANGKVVFAIHERVISESFFEYMASANEHFITSELRILS